MEPGFEAIADDDDEPCYDVKLFGRIIGKLMHLTQTRADIQYAVHTLAGYVAKPAMKHM